MWLPMLLLAVMASGSACPDFCQCRSPVIECHGHAPKLLELDELPPTFTEFKLRSVKQEELRSYIGSMPNSTFLQRLQAIEVTNCSTLTNQRYLRWDLPRSGDLNSPVILNVKLLNVSHNKLKSIPDRCVLLKENLISQLRVFDAGHNQIDNLVFNNCIHMFQLTWLSLASNNLYFISPNNLRHLKSLEYLDLSDNLLQTLDKMFDSLSSLQRLNVAGNKLEHVQANWFQNLSKLYELDISRNKLTFISADALRPLSSLSVFKLAENPLIERDLSLLLCTGRRLETVDASRLGLVRIPAALTRSVKTLKLSGNQLTSIYSGDLDSYPLLKSLDLSDNRLMIIEDDALGRLDSLEELILSGNILLTIPKSLPSGLLKLDLRQNAISKLKVNDIQGIYALKKLYISGNVISTIEEGSFRQLPELQVLDISDNPIKKLPSDTLSGPSNLIFLRMSGLMWLETEENQNQDTAFPFLTPERLVNVDISRSPTLCAQLLADNAALSACKSLQELDLSYTNISTMRSDLAYVLPRLQKLNLIGNEWNCSEDQYWLGQWIRQHKTSINYSTRCITPSDFEGKLLEEMPNLPSSETTKKMIEIPSSIGTLNTSEIHYPTAVTKAIRNLEVFKVQKPKSIAPVVLSTPTTVENYVTGNNVSTTGISNIYNTSFALDSNFATQFLLIDSEYHDNKINKETKLSMPSMLKFEVQESTTRTEEPKDSVMTKNYPANVIKYKSPKSVRKISTQSNSLENKKDGQSELIAHDKNEVSVINERKKITLDTTMVTPTLQKSVKTTTNTPLSILKNTTVETLNTTKISVAKIKDITIKKYKSIKNDVNILNQKSRNSISEFSRSKLLIVNEVDHDKGEANSFAEKLNSQATESGARTSESLANGAHPGMLVLLGAAIGAAAALTVVLSRRATVKRRDRQYHRHENIEVHALTPTTELW